MFFFIGGINPKRHLLNQLHKPCPACLSQDTVNIVRIENKLSLFFIPLFPVSRGKPMYLCERCGWTSHDMSRDPTHNVPRFPDRHAIHCRNCGLFVESRGYQFCPYCGGHL
ncbi:hypothetical protein K7432_013821 [Basidiobolus ranarum]|uniref:Zinc-ribbon 15 domain-containing protein n=1 Tax=Basidiobolus ranarum TaxID=34480 RepID=A0ABR2WIK5_9FUNG